MSLSSGNILFHSSDTFNGTIWRTLLDAGSNVLFLELRDSERRWVTFSALDLRNDAWRWRELSLEEKWWVSLGFAQQEKLLLTLYTDTGNPDQKSVLALDSKDGAIAWWRNNFVVAYVHDKVVIGSDTKFGSKHVALDIDSGAVVESKVHDFSDVQNFGVIKPLQYVHGTAHFDSVAAFVQRKCGLVALHSIEYCEERGIIVVSAFVGEKELANYLMVFNSEGDILLNERLGENLKGIAFDTFFIFQDDLIFVKNKCELVRYKIV